MYSQHSTRAGRTQPLATALGLCSFNSLNYHSRLTNSALPRLPPPNASGPLHPVSSYPDLPLAAQMSAYIQPNLLRLRYLL